MTGHAANELGAAPLRLSAAISTSTSKAPTRELGRFLLRRQLGRGLRGQVWLAYDPRLDRDVALKLLNPDADAATRSAWLRQARLLSRLTHPHIVPLFEADEHQTQPYLVFEWVDGPTLAQVLLGQADGELNGGPNGGPDCEPVSEPVGEPNVRPVAGRRMPARDAVSLMLGVLDALAAGHERGIVHGDLKASNILVGQGGRARVMDFGIAAPVAAQPSQDVFAAAVMLRELIDGVPLQPADTRPIMPPEPPTDELARPTSVHLDDVLHGIVNRALSNNVQARYDSARSLHAALSTWLKPEPSALETGHATLDFLLRRMRHKTDFPALSASVVRIQRVANSESETLASLTEEILQDVSLTNKLLRMVNTVHFSAVAGGSISTVSRAVALVGFAGIRNMALSVILLEQMGNKGHAAQIKEEYLRALMAGMLAAEVVAQLTAQGASHSRHSEDAFLAAMMQNLGRLLTEYYFPEEALQIRQQLPASGAEPAAREAAARQVLGLGFDELGLGVARSWGLPESLQRTMRVPDGEVPTRAVDPQAEHGAPRMRWLARSANALADALLAADGPAQHSALAVVAERYAPALALQAKDLLQCAQNTRARMAQVARAMGLQLAPGAAALRLLAPAPAGPSTGRSAVSADDVLAAQGTAVAAPVVAAQHLGLQAGLETLMRETGPPSLRLNEVLNLVLETLQRALDLRCVVFCLREPRSGQLVGRVALGPGAAEMRAAFCIQIDGTAPIDLFAAVCSKGADLLIADARSVAARLPAWYRQQVNAATFLLLPLRLNGATIGMIYADKATAGSLVLSAQDMGLLKQLRDRAVVAFGKGGGAT